MRPPSKSTLLKVVILGEFERIIHSLTDNEAKKKEENTMFPRETAAHFRIWLKQWIQF